MLLAIDTATQYASLALHDSHAVAAEDTWRAPMHGVGAELASAIQHLLGRSGITIDQLTALAVCIGPGSFTGLRSGIALAKGIAGARGLPLVGVSSLDVLASAHPQASGGLIAVVQAGRGRVIAASYQWRKGRWKSRSEPLLMTWDMLIASIDGPATLTGEISDAGLETLQMAREQGAPIHVSAGALRLRRAGFLAEEAWNQLQSRSAEIFEADHVVPLYVKTKDLS